jgi:hypothetical protein
MIYTWITWQTQISRIILKLKLLEPKIIMSWLKKLNILKSWRLIVIRYLHQAIFYISLGLWALCFYCQSSCNKFLSGWGWGIGVFLWVNVSASSLCCSGQKVFYRFGVQFEPLLDFQVWILNVIVFAQITCEVWYT